MRRQRRATPGLRKNWDHLQPFLPERSGIRVGIIGLLSFIGGLAESTVLILLTLTADGLIRNAKSVQIIGLSLAQRDAILLALLMVVIRVVTIMGASVVSAKFSAEVTGIAQRKVLAAYVRSSYTLRSSRPPGDLNTVAVSHARFTGELASAFTVVAASICGLLAFGGTSLVVNPIATFGIALIGLLVLSLMRPLRARSRAAAREFADSTRFLGQEVQELEMLQREIELFQVGDRALGRVDQQIDSGVASLRRIKVLSMATPQLFQTAMLAAAVVSLLLIVGTIDGADLASVGAVVLLLIRSMSAAQQYVTANQRVIDQSSYAESMSELILTLSTGHSTFGDATPATIAPITIDHVRFSYDETNNVLSDISINMHHGELIGLAGPSGAGKSTLVELLLRLREPTGGTIVGGATAWSEIGPVDFARRVAFVPQQPVLIAGTIADNVDLFRGFPEQRIIRALEEAHLKDDLAGLPDGIHTRLGPDDRALSGGQRQRLTIARALVGDPEILILDEPTSALDSVSEAAVRRTLEELPTGRLVLVIAHRYSTLRSCSRIIVLSNGRIEIDAAPSEVAKRSSFFQAMLAEGA